MNRYPPDVAVVSYAGKTQARRQFTHHAKRWRYGMKAKAPGELMQADHMSINFSEGGGVKEFKATCPVSKWSGLQVYSRATSRNAKRFLAYLQEQAPFPIRSLQVDGGRQKTGCDAKFKEQKLAGTTCSRAL